MKLWIIGLLLLGIAIPIINGQELDDNDEDYEVKRFHVQSRQLNGRSTCIETRRKRSAPQEEDDSQSSNEDDDEEDSLDEEMEVNTNDGREQDESTGILIKDTDLAGNAGILVIQNGVPPNTPFLFELRPVQPDKKDKYFQVADDNNSDDSDDPDFEDDIDDMDNGNDNRFKPDSDLDSDEYDDTSPSRPLVRPTPKPKRKRPSSQNSDEDVMKPIKKKPRRPSSQSLSNKRKPNRKNKTKRNKNKKNKNKKKRKNSHRYETNPETGLRKKVNSNKRVGSRINKGSGIRTVTNTVTTTQTGAGAGDVPGVNCIIINKPSPVLPTQRPFWNILGRSAGERQADRSFGLRKRIGQKLFRQE